MEAALEPGKSYRLEEFGGTYLKTPTLWRMKALRVILVRTQKSTAVDRFGLTGTFLSDREQNASRKRDSMKVLPYFQGICSKSPH